MSKLSVNRKKELLKYWPVRLHLIKEYNAWRISSFEELREYIVSTKTTQEKIRAEANRAY